jgi:hypothetical protein
MKHFAFIGIVLTFASVVVPLKAQERTGADLLQECRVSIEKNPDKVAMLDGVHCVGYLTGVSETFDMWKAFNDRRKQNNPPPACVPGRVTGRELATVVVTYIKAHPNVLHHQLSVVALAALSDAYPCK